MQERKLQYAIGKLIKHYRKGLYSKAKESKYTQKGITSKITEEYKQILASFNEPLHKSVCSSRTINQIEKGEYFNENYDVIFYGLAININKIYTPSRMYLQFFEKLYNDMIVDIDSMNIKNLINHKKVLRSHYKKTYNTLYYGELYEIFEATLDYFIDDKFPTKQFAEKYYQLHDIFDRYTQGLILFLCYNYYMKVDINLSKSVVVSEKLNKFPENNYIHIYVKVFYLVDNNLQFELIQYLNKLKQSESYLNNIFIQYIVNDFFALAVINANAKEAVSKAYEPLQKCLDLVNKYPALFRDKYYSLSHYHIGLYYHFQNNNLLAYRYFKKIIKLKYRNFSILPLLIMVNIEELNIEYVEIVKTIEALETIPYFSDIYNNLLLYFKQKYKFDSLTKQQAISLEDTILYNLLPKYSPLQEEYTLLEQQLIKLSKISGRTKPLLQIRLDQKVY